MSTPPAASIVIPTYREAENLALLVPRIARALTATPYAHSHEVIVVDDNSRDGTDQVLAALADDGHPVRLITRTGERGLSSAVLRGFDEARGEVLVCMDADLSHPPEVLPSLIDLITREEAEFVLGSRYVRGGGTDQAWGLFRWLNSRIATWLARPFTTATDPMSGFFALPRALYQRAETLNPIGYKIGLELIVKCRVTKLREVPIRFANRRLGQSKLSVGEQWRYLRHLKRLADFKFGGPGRAVLAALRQRTP
jgi:dolichol-phosphate mannosyltransferase